ncbi:MAG: leucine-rich repeat domain-containing protein, partial [Clostridia bacterium]|nr:leucine-rich repeat domain-containing protein [Clostridia bacterium]
VINSAYISNEVIKIGDNAFKNYTALTNVEVPQSVVSISGGAFSGCSSLESITLPFVGGSTNASNGYDQVFGYIFGYKTSSSSLTISGAIYQYGSSSGTYKYYHYYIPMSLNSVTITGGSSISYHAFYNCKSLTSVVVDGVSNIDSYAFDNCTLLTVLTIDNSVESIGWNAFYNCNSLAKVNYTGTIDQWAEIERGGGFANYYNLYLNDVLVTEVVISTATRISDNAFDNCISLESVVIQKSVTSIGSEAFLGCSSLTKVMMGEGVISIGDYAFCDCSLLENIVIPDSVTSISYRAFYNCSSLINVKIGDGVESIGEETFYNCNLLTSVIVGNSVTSIGEGAFDYCTLLTKVNYIGTIDEWAQIDFANYSSNPLYYAQNLYINDVLVIEARLTSVSEISAYAFYNCKSLESILISNNVVSIGSYAFGGCSSLIKVNYAGTIDEWAQIEFVSSSSNPLCYAEKLYINDVLVTEAIMATATKISSYAFYNCSSLERIVIPNVVTSIGFATFEGCSNLQELTLPFVGTIKDKLSNAYFGYVFGASSYSYNVKCVPVSLKTVTITGGKYIDTFAFYNCNSLQSINIPDTVVSIGSSAFAYCSSLQSIDVPNSVTSIGYEAFENCSSLTNAVIGNGVTSIGESVFYGCSSLRSISLPFVGATKEGVNNTHFGYIFGAYNYSSNYSCVPTSLKTVIITGGESIGESAFSGCCSLESITLPFVGGSKMATEASRSTLFGYVFGTSSYSGGVETKQYYSPSLSEVYYIPATLQNVVITGGNIFYGAFYDCDSLVDVKVENGVTSIGSSAFAYCNSLTSITLPFAGETRGETENYHFGYIFGASSYLYNGSHVPFSLKTVTITDSTTIGIQVFYDCRSVESIIINDGVESIEGRAFYLCSSLQSIDIPDSVTSIGSEAFYRCTSLQSIDIPDSVTSIGFFAFYNCNSLATVIFGENSQMTSIGSAAFEGCSSLISIKIPDKVDKIGSSAFAYCSSLKTATIGDSLTSLDDSVFYQCISLQSINIPDIVTSIGSYAFYDCKNLISVVIGSSVEKIGSSAFLGCDKIVEVYNKSKLKITASSSNGYVGWYALNVYAEENESKLTTDSNGYIIYTDGVDKILLGYIGKETDLTLPNGITAIYKYAFYYCSSLTSVTIPDSVTSIGDYAFTYCDSLTSVTFKDTSTWYKTTNYTNWQNKTGGTETNVVNFSTNATYLKSYYDSYWYKI